MREAEAPARGGYVLGGGASGSAVESAGSRLAPGGFDADSQDDTGPKARRAPVESRWLPSFAPRSRPPMPAQPQAQACTDCAVVESIRTVETGGSNGVGGTLAGGLLGAILGHEIAHGDLRGFASVLGAVGGALTGRAIERANNRQVRYDVVLRLPNGGSQVHSYDSPPPVKVGDLVPVPAVTYARAPRFNTPD
jgi:outer membrane lipoprotein SlyB